MSAVHGSEGFDTNRQQWYMMVTTLFSHPVDVYKVGSGGSNEKFGPGQPPGSKYTDYYYNPTTGNFVAYRWDSDGTKHKVELPSSTLRSDGQSFAFCEWRIPPADTVAAYGDLLGYWKLVDGMLRKPGFVDCSITRALQEDWYNS
jgi:hypothetical protein